MITSRTKTNRLKNSRTWNANRRIEKSDEWKCG